MMGEPFTVDKLAIRGDGESFFKTKEEAEKDAERLARKERFKVYVSKAIKSYEIPDSPVRWNNL
jgi:hypothetical protein